MGVCVVCGRPSPMPEPYEPLCTKHYIASVNQAQADAATRFRAHIESLFAAAEDAPQ